SGVLLLHDVDDLAETVAKYVVALPKRLRDPAYDVGLFVGKLRRHDDRSEREFGELRDIPSAVEKQLAIALELDLVAIGRRADDDVDLVAAKRGHPRGAEPDRQEFYVTIGIQPGVLGEIARVLSGAARDRAGTDACALEGLELVR